MNLKLKKEQIRLAEVICSRYCQTDAEYDIIVPDVKPDVAKVLNVSGDAAITHKTIQNDRVVLQGVVRLDILYIPDDDMGAGVKSISCVQDFSHTIEAKGAKPGMSLVAEAECELFEYNLLNSRKLNICTKLGLNIKLTSSSDAALATAIEGNENIRTNTEHLKLCHSFCDADREILLKEQLDVPSGKPELYEILKVSAKPSQKELRFLDGKAIVKGDVKVSTLYCGGMEDNTVQCMEHCIPFTEILEIDELTENMTGEADYSIKDIYTEILQDSDGDNRILNTEITLSVCIKAMGIADFDVICDAYSPDFELVIDKTPCNTEQLLETAKAQVTQKETVSVPDYLPEVYQICDCNGVPSIENIAAENGSVTVSGYMTYNILYMSQEREAPISGFSHVLPFTHTFDIPGLCSTSVCDVKAETEHISYTLSGPSSIELRSIILLSLKASNPCTCHMISEINCDEASAPPQIPSITVYFVKENDTLWNIAKRFRIAPEDILAVNGSESDILKAGKKIYIFK